MRTRTSFPSRRAILILSNCADTSSFAREHCAETRLVIQKADICTVTNTPRIFISRSISDATTCGIGRNCRVAAGGSKDRDGWRFWALRLVPFACRARRTFYEARITDSRTVLECKVNPAFRINFRSTFSAPLLVRLGHEHPPGPIQSRVAMKHINGAFLGRCDGRFRHPFHNCPQLDRHRPGLSLLSSFDPMERMAAMSLVE